MHDKNEEKRDYDDLLRRLFDAHGTEIISDYVPQLSFVTQLQGWVPYLTDLRNRGRAVIGKIIEVEKHKERAAHITADKDENYVPDFVDVLLQTPVEDGKPLPDADIASLLLVSPCHHLQNSFSFGSESAFPVLSHKFLGMAGFPGLPERGDGHERHDHGMGFVGAHGEP
jgi:hypothetical protein